MHEQLMGNAQLHQRLRFSYGRWGFNRRMLKTACPVVWEGLRAQSRRPDPITMGYICRSDKPHFFTPPDPLPQIDR